MESGKAGFSRTRRELLERNKTEAIDGDASTSNSGTRALSPGKLAARNPLAGAARRGSLAAQRPTKTAAQSKALAAVRLRAIGYAEWLFRPVTGRWPAAGRAQA